MFVRACATVGAMRRFAIVGSGVAVLAIAGLADATQAAQAPRAKAAGIADSACGNSAALAASTKTARAAAGISPFDIAKWVGEKSAGGAVGAVGGLAFDEVLKLTGLKEKLVGPDPALERLDQIEQQLEGVNERLDLIAGKLDKLTTEFRETTLGDHLGALCQQVIQVEDLYYNHFIFVVQAGLAVGKIWADYPTTEEATHYLGTLIGELPAAVKKAVYPQAGDAQCPDPEHPDENLLVCNTPKGLVTNRLDTFRKTFTRYSANLAPGIISTYLTVHPTKTSIMTDFGKYLMTRRTLNHADSVAMRTLYDQFAQAEALAAWMSMEYYSVTTAEGPTADTVLSTYKHDKSLEEQELSPMIPEGDVIDLEQTNAGTTRKHPIWALASTQATTHWPVGVESNNLVTTAADGAGDAVKAFNGSQSCSVDAPPCFKAWKIPSTVDLKSLLSENCAVDRTKNPPQLPKTCTPLVPGPDYPSVGSYLAKLNPTDSAWQGVFAAPAAKQTFIWTSDRRSHKTNCGYQTVVFYKDVYSRTYSFSVGLPLKFTTTPLSFTSLNQMWPLYPIMPDQIPDYGVWTADVAHIKCDAYTDVQIHDASNKGIVLVTDNTGDVDFMAQPGSAAVQDTTAQAVADHAAADAKRYGRHHHGRFSGLSRHTLRDEVPEARSGEPGYLIAAHAIDGGDGFTVTARGEGTDDTFTITDRPSGAVLHTCTRVDGGAGRHGCQHLKGGHGGW